MKKYGLHKQIIHFLDVVMPYVDFIATPFYLISELFKVWFSSSFAFRINNALVGGLSFLMGVIGYWIYKYKEKEAEKLKSLEYLQARLLENGFEFTDVELKEKINDLKQTFATYSKIRIAPNEKSIFEKIWDLYSYYWIGYFSLWITAAIAVGAGAVAAATFVSSAPVTVALVAGSGILFLPTLYEYFKEKKIGSTIVTDSDNDNINNYVFLELVSTELLNKLNRGVISNNTPMQINLSTATSSNSLPLSAHYLIEGTYGWKKLRVPIVAAISGLMFGGIFGYMTVFYLSFELFVKSPITLTSIYLGSCFGFGILVAAHEVFKALKRSQEHKKLVAKLTVTLSEIASLEKMHVTYQRQIREKISQDPQRAHQLFRDMGESERALNCYLNAEPFSYIDREFRRMDTEIHLSKVIKSNTRKFLTTSNHAVLPNYTIPLFILSVFTSVAFLIQAPYIALALTVAGAIFNFIEYRWERQENKHLTNVLESSEKKYLLERQNKVLDVLLRRLTAEAEPSVRHISGVSISSGDPAHAHQAQLTESAAPLPLTLTSAYRHYTSAQRASTPEFYNEVMQLHDKVGEIFRYQVKNNKPLIIYIKGCDKALIEVALNEVNLYRRETGRQVAIKLSAPHTSKPFNLISQWYNQRYPALKFPHSKYVHATCAPSLSTRLSRSI